MSKPIHRLQIVIVMFAMYSVASHSTTDLIFKYLFNCPNYLIQCTVQQRIIEEQQFVFALYLKDNIRNGFLP